MKNVPLVSKEGTFVRTFLPGFREDPHPGRMFALEIDVALRVMFGGSIHMTGFHYDPTMDLGSEPGALYRAPAN
jgi:hypothetical protein